MQRSLMGFGAILNAQNVAKAFKLEQITERGLSFLVWSSAFKDVMSKAATVLRCTFLYYQGMLVTSTLVERC